jgi:hypothetical protein
MNGASEEARLATEIAWLKKEIPTLTTSLSKLQQQHAVLTAQAAQVAAQPQRAPAYGAGMPPHALQQPEVAGLARQPAPSPQASPWTEQTNPENGQAYYWNSVTGESTYTRPDGFSAAAGGSATASGLPQVRARREGCIRSFSLALTHCAQTVYAHSAPHLCRCYVLSYPTT